MDSSNTSVKDWLQKPSALGAVSTENFINDKSISCPPFEEYEGEMNLQQDSFSGRRDTIKGLDMWAEQVSLLQLRLAC